MTDDESGKGSGSRPPNSLPPSGTPPSPPTPPPPNPPTSVSSKGLDFWDSPKVRIQAVRSFTKLALAFIWAFFLVFALYFLARHSCGIYRIVDAFLSNKQSVSFSAGTSGVSVSIQAALADAARNPPTEGFATSSEPTPSEIQELGLEGERAIRKIQALGFHNPEPAAKLLWVDDHPGNNIGLQAAFEAMGLRVVTIECNERIPEAFKVAGGFDVVITDMGRDQLGDQSNQLPKCVPICLPAHQPLHLEVCPTRPAELQMLTPVLRRQWQPPVPRFGEM